MSAESSPTLRLGDGRALGYAEWGDGSGFPLFHFHGSSSSRLEHPLQPEVLEGVRLVTIDRPGHGLSDFQRERTLLDWPEDVAALADHLEIERFAVSAWSAGMDRFSKVALAMSRRVPWALNRRLMAMMGRVFTKDPEGAAQRRFASLPAPDRQALSDPRAADMLLASMVESFRAGSDGSAWEARLLTLPWGFGLQDIAVPVALWHGDADINSPLAAATYPSRTIPNASLTVFPDEGHFLILKRWGEIVRQLTDAPGR